MSPYSNYSRWIVIGAIMMTTSSVLTTALNCEFELEDTDWEEVSEGHWIVTSRATISEKLGAGETIWDVPTKNIIGSKVSTIPHYKYLTGHRYSTRYVYKTTASFPDFVISEGAKEVQRNVTFTCQDGKELRIHFRFPLDDVNDPPEFLEAPKTLDVDLAKVTENTIINENSPIMVREIDFFPEFMQISVTSDRRDILKVELEEQGELGKGVGKIMGVNLKLNLEGGLDSIDVGRYTLNLYATDGVYTVGTPLIVNIIKSS